jgi:hypothetical protein
LSLGRLIPDGFLTIRQASDKLANAIYSGVPDSDAVKEFRDKGADAADGTAINDAISKLWQAVDKQKIQPFVVGPTGGVPLKLSPEMSRGIPALRTRGQDFNFLRPRNLYYKQFVEWFGPDLSTVSVVFREEEVTRLMRDLLRTRRRRTRSVGNNKVGRPRRRCEVQTIIRALVDEGRWSPTESIKALSVQVNRRGKWADPASDDTVTRALDDLHAATGDRKFDRVRREAKKRAP